MRYHPTLEFLRAKRQLRSSLLTLRDMWHIQTQTLAADALVVDHVNPDPKLSKNDLVRIIVLRVPELVSLLHQLCALSFFHHMLLFLSGGTQSEAAYYHSKHTEHLSQRNRDYMGGDSVPYLGDNVCEPLTFLWKAGERGVRFICDQCPHGDRVAHANQLRFHRSCSAPLCIADRQGGELLYEGITLGWEVLNDTLFELWIHGLLLVGRL